MAFFKCTLGNYFKMVAKTMFGFEEILAKELRNLGAVNVVEGIRMVSFEGDTGFMYKANLCLRTAIKILMPIHSFYVKDETDLYNEHIDLITGKHRVAEETRDAIR